MVSKGAVQFSRLAADGAILDSIMVGAGQFADFFGPVFQPKPSRRNNFAANTTTGHRPRETASRSRGRSGYRRKPIPRKKRPKEKNSDTASESKDIPCCAWLKEALGFENRVGHDQLNTTYSKSVIQPRLQDREAQDGALPAPSSHLQPLRSRRLYQPGATKSGPSARMWDGAQHGEAILDRCRTWP
jgi:hypothetical protein